MVSSEVVCQVFARRMHQCFLHLLCQSTNLTCSVRFQSSRTSPTATASATPVKIKVKAFHTRYRALGLELIPVLRQSACHPPGGRLPLLSTRPAVTFSAAEHHRRLADTKLYCLVTEAHRCEQLAQGCYAALPHVGFETTTC